MSVAGAANRLYLLAAAPARLRFERGLRDPRRAQHAILARILRENAASDYGRRFGFDRIRTIAEYQARVPLIDYDVLADDIDHITSGRDAVLTESAVRCLEPTGGSSAAAKLIPYTRPLLGEFSAATQPWVFDLLRSRPALRRGRAYWAVTPPARHASRTSGGVPIGLEHDSDYFPAVARALLDRVLGVPRAVSRAPDVTTCRYLTLRALLALPDLAFISVWNPSFLTLLAHALDEHWRDLLADLGDGGLRVPLDGSLRAELALVFGSRPRLASRLRRRFGVRPPEDLGTLWERLSLVSCWTDGHAARAVDGMRCRFPRVEIQGKGLLATEGVISIPLFDAEAPVAAVTSHFLEFLPAETANTGTEACTVEQLAPGQTYEVVLTTSGGLYRYRLRDVVEMCGRYRQTPTLRFVGRADGASDVAGEKLTPVFVESVIDAAMRATGVRAPFVMLAPAWHEPPRYLLFVEADVDAAERLARETERRLRDAHHYGLCRALGQLGEVRAIAVRDGARIYENVRAARGQRAGAVKPVALDLALHWEREFTTQPPNAAASPASLTVA